MEVEGHLRGVEGAHQQAVLVGRPALPEAGGRAGAGEDAGEEEGGARGEVPGGLAPFEKAHAGGFGRVAPRGGQGPLARLVLVAEDRTDG